MDIPGNQHPEITGLCKAAIAQGLFRDEDTSLTIIDQDIIKTRLELLCDLFPASALHGMAIKANPLVKLLRFSREVSKQVGVEAASMGEVHLALAAGFEPSRIIYDSPVKTATELAHAISLGVHINVDNLDELERIRKTGPGSGTFGLRINPQVGAGTIAESSVAGIYSKFGIPLGLRRDEIIGAYAQNPWLTGLHLHVGSQGCSMDLLVEGIGRLYDLAIEVNRERAMRKIVPLSIFDIGGGLPVSYHRGIPPPSMEEYAGRIRQRAPGLFEEPAGRQNSGTGIIDSAISSGSFRMMTEFGRWIFTNAGFTISRVEYVKRDPGLGTAMIHLGADMFVRECLNPKDWSHDYLVLDPNGNPRQGKSSDRWNLAGPLCFAGDILARDLELPGVCEGDIIAILDTGGYTFSMWSRYNSRQFPRILGFSEGRFEILKERESLDDLVKFWQ